MRRQIPVLRQEMQKETTELQKQTTGQQIIGLQQQMQQMQQQMQQMQQQMNANHAQVMACLKLLPMRVSNYTVSGSVAGVVVPPTGHPLFHVVPPTRHRLFQINRQVFLLQLVPLNLTNVSRQQGPNVRLLQLRLDSLSCLPLPLFPVVGHKLPIISVFSLEITRGGGLEGFRLYSKKGKYVFMKPI